MWWTRLKKTLTNPSKLQKIAKAPQIKCWLLVTFLLCLLFYWTSEGEFSFMLTLASVLQMLSYIPLILQTASGQEGLSFFTFILFILVHSSRLCSILVYPSYLPYDSTGDWLYQVTEIICLIAASLLAYKIKPMNETSVILLSIPLSFFFALLVHPKLNNNFLTDSLWAFSMYLESIALVPIRISIRKMDDVESFSIHFLVAQGISKVLCFIFWFRSYSELNAGGAGFFIWTPGTMTFVSQLVSCAVTADYIYHYVKKALLESASILPA